MEMLEQKLDVVKEFADASPLGVVVFDFQAEKMLYTNRLAQDITGLRPGDSFDAVIALGENILPEDRTYALNRFAQILLGAEDRKVQFRITGTETTRVLECQLSIVMNRQLLYITVQDLTRAVQHEAYLVEYGAKKNTLLDTLTHQISGALRLMQNLTRATRKLSEFTGDNVSTYLSLLDANSAHCLEIINSLKKEEFVKAAHISVKMARVDVTQLVGYIYFEMTRSYEGRRCRLISPETPIYAMTDDVKLLQVINNLVSNAMKFTPVEGEVVIRIGNEDDAVTISVEDQGIGIPDALKPFIFDRMTRAGRPGLNGEPSFGFGLSICKTLLTLIDGSIRFESEEHRGTAFFVTLPMKAEVNAPR